MKNARFEYFDFGNGKVARNRVVVPPMASQTADSRGKVTAKTLAHYRNLSSSGAGLVFVEYSFIHPSGRGEEHQLGIDDEDKVEGLSRVAQIIQESGSLAGIQIVHVGGKTSSDLAGGTPLGPSPLAVPVKGLQLETPREASLDDIQSLIDGYVMAADRATRAGFDVVELHAAHGYGFNQWLSPLTNQRFDEFGGSLENRARLLLNVVRLIKERLPRVLLAVRLPAQDHLRGGLPLGDMIWVAQRLQQRGVDLIDVSSGLGGWRRRDDRTEQGYLVEDAATLKKFLRIPVIGVGGILDAATIERFLLEKKLDFAAVGRAILKDPRGWGEAHLNQERGDKTWNPSPKESCGCARSVD